MTVGILALQGCIEPHVEMFSRLGISTTKVTDPSHLKNIDRLVIPGGESTTMLRLIEKTGLTDPIIEFGKSKPIWGICAGAILLADEVKNPEQKSLKLIDILTERNSYGSQINSFKASVSCPTLHINVDADFIRAPRIFTKNTDVEILAEHEGAPILVRQKNILASSFHVELGEDTKLHEYFLAM